MAILESILGLKVTIISQGRTLEEYHDDSEYRGKYKTPVDRISTKYIECVSDEEFLIELETKPDFQHIGKHTHFYFDVYADGTGVALTKLPVSLAAKNQNHLLKYALTRLNKKEVTRQRLKFGQIRKVDDADPTNINSDAKIAASLGEIIVRVHRVSQGKTSRREYASRSEHSAIDEISEKALKGRAISHSVRYGAPERVAHKQSKEGRYLDPKDSPLALFIFKYRSRGDLQAEHIIPRSPSPNAPTYISPVESRVSAQERLIQLKREIEQIKSEIKDEDSEGLPTVRKRRAETLGGESNGRAYKTIRHESGTLVVDLTDD